MNIVLSTLDIENLNHFLSDRKLPYRISLHDGCGWQYFTVKRKDNSQLLAEDLQSAKLQTAIHAYLFLAFPDRDFNLIFDQSGIQFRIE